MNKNTQKATNLQQPQPTLQLQKLQLEELDGDGFSAGKFNEAQRYGGGIANSTNYTIFRGNLSQH